MFEYDSGKSISNAKKHGIDFVEAQRLWNDEKLAVVDMRTEDEPRWLAIGRIDDQHWSAVFAMHNGKIRLILVRRSQSAEIARYEGP